MIKTLLNTIPSRLLSIPVNELAVLTDGSSVISFDIFDTLVLRNVRAPKDVFSLVERQLIVEFGAKECAGFAELRVAAEKEARLAAGLMEVTLAEIYERIPLCGHLAERARAIECDFEIQLATPNTPVVDFYKSCLERGKRIVLISDMYLPQAIIEEILSNCGIDGYETLFLSCVDGKTKRSGDLFSYVAKELGVAPTSIAHVGDSLQSDYFNARRAGFKGILIGHSESSKHFLELPAKCHTIDAGALAALAVNACPCDSGEYYRFGFECFGPYLFGFSRWLAAGLKKKGIDKIYFLSRDGLILKRAFEAMGFEGFDSRYLEVSRRSLRVPLLHRIKELDALVDMMPPSRIVSVDAIFDTLGLDAAGYSDLLGHLGINRKSVFERRSLKHDEHIVRLIAALRVDFEGNSKKQDDALRMYLAQMQVGGRFAIVDIGWSGGMQRYLESTLKSMGIECEISGFYTGVVAYATRNTKYGKLDMNGYVFDCLADGPDADIRRLYVGFLESLFLEQDGTVLGYEIDGGGCAHAVRAPYEYREGIGIADEARKIAQLQNGALDYVSKTTKIKAFELLNPEPREAYAGIHTMGADPSAVGLAMFGDFRFYDDGAVERLAAPKSLLVYARSPKQLESDFLASRWKVGFAKRLFRCLPLPYESLLMRLAKMGG